MDGPSGSSMPLFKFGFWPFAWSSNDSNSCFILSNIFDALNPPGILSTKIYLEDWINCIFFCLLPSWFPIMVVQIDSSKCKYIYWKILNDQICLGNMLGEESAVNLEQLHFEQLHSLFHDWTLLKDWISKSVMVGPGP